MLHKKRVEEMIARNYGPRDTRTQDEACKWGGCNGTGPRGGSCNRCGALIQAAAPPPEDGTPTKRAFCYWHGEFNGESCAICVKLAKYAPSKPVPPTGEQGQGESLMPFTIRKGFQHFGADIEVVLLADAKAAIKRAAPTEPDARVIALLEQAERYAEVAFSKSGEAMIYRNAVRDALAILRGTR